MPLDSTDYSPWRGDPPRKPRTFWKETIRDMALGMVFLPSALTVSAFAGAAIDGFPPLPDTIPPPPGFPVASLSSQVGSTALFFLLVATFAWWLARRVVREVDDA